MFYVKRKPKWAKYVKKGLSISTKPIKEKKVYRHALTGNFTLKGPEDVLHLDTAMILNSLGLWFTYFPSGEYRFKKTAIVLKRKGVKSGVSDFIVRHIRGGITYFLYLEAKCGYNKQDKEGFQRNFQELVEVNLNEKYYVYKSIEELKKILIMEGLIR
jgi:hypothetical protein